MIEVYFDWTMLAARLKGEMTAGLGLKGMVDAYRSEWRRWQGTDDVVASTGGSITTAMDHIWKEKQKHGLIFVWGLGQQGILSDTDLDCGNESVLSFNSSSDTSVSRISGLDLLPYLRHRKKQEEGFSMVRLEGNQWVYPPTWMFNPMIKLVTCDKRKWINLWELLSRWHGSFSVFQKIRRVCALPPGGG